MRRDDVEDEELDDGDEEDEPLGPDEEEVAEDVRRRVIAALPRVLAKAERVVLGDHKFASDDVGRACIAFLRLAPRLVAREKRETRDNTWLGYHPSHTPERAAALLRRIQREEARALRGEPEDPDWKPL